MGIYEPRGGQVVKKKKIRPELKTGVRVNVEVVDDVELEPSGKLRWVVSNVIWSLMSIRDFQLVRYTKLRGAR